jgi:hypothetical protein
MRLNFTILLSLLTLSGRLLADGLPPGTAPVIGTTTFNNAFSATGALEGPGASPISAKNVGTVVATGWDFTGTSPGDASMSISAIAGGANPGGTADFAIRMSTGSGTISMQSGAVSSDNASAFFLQSVYFRLAAASSANITLTGYLNGTAVPGATLTINGIASDVWTEFDVHATAAFQDVNQFVFTQAATSSVTLTQMVVDQITIASANPLPLTLTGFSGQRSGDNVLLKWTTASEQNTSHFDIQRGTDGIAYSSVGVIPAAGNSTQPLNYQFTDVLPASTTPTWYYRLLMTDEDGQSTYSPVLTIGAANPSTFIMYAYPNPFSSQVTLTIQSPQPDNALLLIADMSGRILLTERMPLQKGTNLVPLPLGSLAKGVYTLSVSTTGAKHTIGVVKTE